MKYKRGDILYINDLNNECTDSRFRSGKHYFHPGDMVRVLEYSDDHQAYDCWLLSKEPRLSDNQYIEERCLTRWKYIKETKGFTYESKVELG